MTTTGFDVDAWLDEAAPPTRAVKIYGRGDLVAQLQLAQAAAEQPDDPAAINDPRLAGAPPTLALSLAPGLLAELEASARTFVVRGLLDAERFREEDAVREAAGLKPSQSISNELNEELEPRLIALASVEPVLSTEQVARLRAKIGQAQFQMLVNAVVQASGEPIDVPLSRLGSGTGQDS